MNNSITQGVGGEVMGQKEQGALCATHRALPPRTTPAPRHSKWSSNSLLHAFSAMQLLCVSLKSACSWPRSVSYFIVIINHVSTSDTRLMDRLRCASSVSTLLDFNRVGVAKIMLLELGIGGTVFPSVFCLPLFSLRCRHHQQHVAPSPPTCCCR